MAASQLGGATALVDSTKIGPKTAAHGGAVK
jgi:hypothetical protein